MQVYHIPSDHFERHWKVSDWVRLLAVFNEKPAAPRKGMRISDFVGV